MMLIIFFVALVGTSVFIYKGFQRLRLAPDNFELGMLAYLPWTLFGLTLVLTLFFWYQQSHVSHQNVSDRFLADVSKVEETIKSRRVACEDLLQAGRNLLTSQSRFDASLLDDYIRSIALESKHPYVGGMGYIADVPESRVSRFLTATRRRRGDQFRIFPSGERDQYQVVEIAEPDNKLGPLAGYDLGSDPEAKTILEEARARDRPTLSSRLLLPDDPQHPALLYLLPVFETDAAAPASGADTDQAATNRFAPLRGWVFERFRADEFFKNVIKGDSPGVQFQAFDGPDASKASLIFDSNEQHGGAKIAKGPWAVTRTLDIAGRQWTLRFVAPAGFQEGTTASYRPAWVFAFGLLFSLACFALLSVMRWGKRFASILAHELTVDLEQRTSALANSPNGIVIADATDPEMPVLWVNTRFERMTGYSASEIIGKNCRVLQNQSRDQKGLHDLRRALRDNKEVRVVLRNYKKDGTPFWNELTVSPVRNAQGRVMQYIGHLNDVTEREQTEHRLSSQVSVIRALSESPTIEEAAVRTLQALCESQGWDLGVFWELDARNQTLRCLDVWHHPELEIQEFENYCRQTAVSREQGLPGQVWARSEAVWVEDMEKQPDYPERSLLLNSHLSSACGFPIASRRGLQGVLTFYSRTIWPLNKNLLLLMVTTSNQISQFMERQQNQGQQQEVAALERGLAEFMGDGLVAMDREGFCIYANSAAGKLLGYPVAMMVGQNLHTLLHPRDAVQVPCDAYRCPVLQSLQSTRPCHIEDHQVFYTRDRVPVPVAYTTSPIIDHGLIRGVVITMNDVTSRRQQLDALEQQLREKEDALQKALLSVGPGQPVPILPSPTEDAAPAPAAIKRILIVEEDAAARSQMAQALEGPGRAVYQASTAEEALAAGQVDLMITECILAGMNGKVIADRLKIACPSLRVLYISSYTQQAIQDLGIISSDALFLQKPLDPALFVEKATQILA